MLREIGAHDRVNSPFSGIAVGSTGPPFHPGLAQPSANGFVSQAARNFTAAQCC